MIVRELLVTLRNVFRRPATVEFPRVVRPRAERYRAGFALLRDEQGDELCIGCLACERICPSGVVKVKAGPKRESPVTCASSSSAAAHRCAWSSVRRA